MFWFFGREACGILTPRPRMETTSTAMESEVLTTGPQGKSQDCLDINFTYKIIKESKLKI